MSILNIYADGGARGNPGPAAIGFSIIQDGKEIFAKGQFIGRATNNQTEYKAVLAALMWLEKNKSYFAGPLQLIKVFLDSKLVVNQLNGLYKIKNAGLRNLIVKVRNVEGSLASKGLTQKIIYHHIPREQNKRADELLNQALDEHFNLKF